MRSKWSQPSIIRTTRSCPVRRSNSAPATRSFHASDNRCAEPDIVRTGKFRLPSRCRSPDLSTLLPGDPRRAHGMVICASSVKECAELIHPARVPGPRGELRPHALSATSKLRGVRTCLNHCRGCEFRARRAHDVTRERAASTQRYSHVTASFGSKTADTLYKPCRHSSRN
jgi:hypothetical protein